MKQQNNISDSPWLSMEQAGEYLGIGKTVLYGLAQDGRIPSNKVGKKWVFEKSQLDTWARSNQPIEQFFVNTEFNIEENLALREPQREAYLQTFDFFKRGKNKAIIQIPVGCGKSGIASILPFGIAEGRVLVLAPNLQIKIGLQEAMDITNRPKCFWRKASILSDAQMLTGPYSCTLDSGNISVAKKCHIVITNVQQLATNVEKWLHQFPDDFFDMIIVDEAHHSAAESWKKVEERFPNAKVIYMTATPFRSDRQKIEGELIYRYSFRSATLKGYIKRLKASYVAPSQIELGFKDQGGKIYTLEEVSKLKEKDWFSRGVALATPCNQHIVDASLQKLEELRQTGTRHQLIAVACSINHAKEIRAMYVERGFSAEIIHSEQDPEAQEKVMGALKNGTLDCIVQVQMLGEGFDHPHLSVAAIFRPYRSLAPYIQFVGRIMRVIVQNDPSHPDNIGHIVTHWGMNIDQRLKEFNDFEKDDEAFWDKVIGGEEPEVPKKVLSGDARLKSRESPVVVSGEIVQGLFEEDFTSPEDEQLIAELRNQLTMLGLDPNDADDIVKKRKDKASMAQKPASPNYPILPQKQLEEARNRLYEQSNRMAKILLNHVELKIHGTEIPYKYTSLGVTGRGNFVCAVKMVNQEIKTRLGKDRDQCSVEEIQAILSSSDNIIQKLARSLYKAKSEYDKKQA